MIFTKSILKPKEDNDGKRISVMARHTLVDGTTPDSRITKDSFDLWLRELAPPAKLVGDYYKRGLSWEDYAREYLKLLKTPEVSSKVKALARWAAQEDITLLCIEESAAKCHRRLLAEECQRLEPLINIEHR